MPEVERKVTLYYMNGCKHCDDFKPVWEEIKERIKKINKSNKMVQFAVFEADENPEEIKQAEINGFPTINITIGDRTFEYSGERKVDPIMNTLLETTVPPQKGQVTDKDAQDYGHCAGGARLPKTRNLTDNEYRIKYAKYKAKYFKMMSKMQF